MTLRYVEKKIIICYGEKFAIWMPSSNVYLLAFVQWPRKEVQMTKISAHIYFPFLQMDFFLPYQLLLE